MRGGSQGSFVPTSRWNGLLIGCCFGLQLFVFFCDVKLACDFFNSKILFWALVGRDEKGLDSVAVLYFGTVCLPTIDCQFCSFVIIKHYMCCFGKQASLFVFVCLLFSRVSPAYGCSYKALLVSLCWLLHL
jgi:hypothetical protein